MVSRWSVVSLALALCALAAPSTARGATVTLLERPVGDVVTLDGRLYALSPDLRAVVAMHRGGHRLWRAKLQGEPQDAGRIEVVDTEAGPRLAVATRDKLRLLSLRGGEVVAERDLGRPLGAGRRRCDLLSHGGACALACGCDFQVVRCDTLEAIGRESRRLAHEAWVVGGQDAPAGCGGRPPSLIARAGDLVIAALTGDRADGPLLGAAHPIVALDARTGGERWRSEALGQLWSSPSLSGASPDAATCWVGDVAGRVEVFDCATGARRWGVTRALPEGADPQVDYVPAPAGLLVRDGEQVTLRSLSDGTTLWGIHAPDERVIAGPVGQRAPLRIGMSKSVRVVSPAAGELRATLEVPAPGPRDLYDLGDGWLVTGRKGLRRFDRHGVRTAERALSPVNEVAIGDGLVVVRGLDVVTFVDKGSLLPVGEMTGATYEIVGVEGALGRDVVALYRHPGEAWDAKDPVTFGALLLVRLRAPGRR